MSLPDLSYQLHNYFKFNHNTSSTPLMAVFRKFASAGVAIDQGFGYSLLFMLIISSILNGFVFFFHYKKSRKLISKMFCMLAFSGNLILIVSLINVYILSNFLASSCLSLFRTSNLTLFCSFAAQTTSGKHFHYLSQAIET